MQFLPLQQSIDFFRRMGSLINSKDHLSIHVLQIRPKRIQRKVILVVFLNHLMDLSKGLVSPPALVMAEAPERRNMPSSNILMVLLQNWLRVFIAQNNNKVDMPSNGVVDKFI
jgi:hypothetical protein